MGGRRVAIPYLAERKGRFFFEPRGAIRADGFKAEALGSNRDVAEARALEIYQTWQRRRAGLDPAAKYPVGSVGEAWEKWVATDEWPKLARKTRNGEWWPAWRLRIEPMFGKVAPSTVTYDQVSKWRAAVDQRDGPDAAHRAIKIWRRLWKIMASMKYCRRDDDPSLGIVNTMLPVRSQSYSEGEVVRAVKHAWRAGYRGLACIIAVCWDTQFSPGDVRTLTAKHRATNPVTGRLMFDRSKDGRRKTKVAVIGTLSRRTEALLSAYWGDVEWTPDAILFRNRSGNGYREDTLPDDYRAIRAALFGPGDDRQLRDLRRSGAMEANAGGVDGKVLGQKMGNGIAQTDFLQKTYLPVDPVVVDMADQARMRGRKAMRGKVRK